MWLTVELHSSGHARQASTYFSKFTTAPAQLHLALPTSKLSKKSKSVENILGEEKLESSERPYHSNSSLLSPTSTEQQVEEEIDSKVQSLTDLSSSTSNKYRKVTIPAVKYAVTLEQPRNMAASKCATSTDLLDRTLLTIRMNLVRARARARAPVIIVIATKKTNSCLCFSFSFSIVLTLKLFSCFKGVICCN